MGIVLATCADLPHGDDDAPLLIEALAARGLAASSAVWNDATVPWHEAALVVLRSTWDYPSQRQRFVAWVESVGETTQIANAPAVVRWNTDKRYLLELEGRGIPIVPTVVLEPGAPVTLPAHGELVVKPSVSAGAKDTGRFAADQRERARAHATQLLASGRTVLVQPYQASVDAQGEAALLYFAGRYSHAIRKGPLLEPGQSDVPGLFAPEEIAAWEPTRQERRAAEDILDALPFARNELLYARVDLVAGEDGAPRLLELELTEPSLFLSHHARAPSRFAEAIAALTVDAPM